MNATFKITFSYLLILALVGLLMRAMPLFDFSGWQYDQLRHAHSHLAFLGWVYSAFYLAFAKLFLPEGSMASGKYRQLFWLTQIIVAGMFLSFWFNGYNSVSIAFLAMHTALAYFFLFWFWKDLGINHSASPGISRWFAKMGIVCFVLSSLGPFAIPIIQIFAYGNPAYQKMAVHFYLHFQYNGWFVFGMFAMLFRLFEQRGLTYSSSLAKGQFWLLALSLIPAWFQMLPFQHLPLVLEISLQFAVVAQVLAILIFIKNDWTILQKSFRGWQRTLLVFSLTALFLKVSCQLVLILPGISEVIDIQNRFLMIAYLHLLFLGCITPFLFFLFSHLKWGDWASSVTKTGLSLFLVGVLLTEGSLFGQGLHIFLEWNWLPFPAMRLFIETGVLASGVGMIVFGVFELNLITKKSTIFSKWKMAKEKYKTGKM